MGDGLCLFLRRTRTFFSTGNVSRDDAAVSPFSSRADLHQRSCGIRARARTYFSVCMAFFFTLASTFDARKNSSSRCMGNYCPTRRGFPRECLHVYDRRSRLRLSTLVARCTTSTSRPVDLLGVHAHEKITFARLWKLQIRNKRTRRIVHCYTMNIPMTLLGHFTSEYRNCRRVQRTIRLQCVGIRRRPIWGDENCPIHQQSIHVSFLRCIRDPWNHTYAVKFGC